MGRFIKNIILLLGISCILYPIALSLWCWIMPLAMHGNVNYRIGSYGHLSTRIKEADTTTHTDILFLGSSLSYRGFDPRLFSAEGISTFNLGSSSQTHVQTNALLEHYLGEIKPQLIVYECAPKSFIKDGVESACDLIANAHIDKSTWDMALDLNHMKVYNTLIYGSFRQFLSLNSDYEEPISHEGDTYIPGGFVEQEFATGINRTVTPGTKEWKPRNLQLEYFLENTKLIKEHGIPLLILRSPVTKRKSMAWKNNSELDALLTEHSDHFYNFNELVNLDDSLHFYDATHLNSDGVEIFNRTFIDIIKRDQLLRIEINE